RPPQPHRGGTGAAEIDRAAARAERGPGDERHLRRRRDARADAALPQAGREPRGRARRRGPGMSAASGNAAACNAPGRELRLVVVSAGASDPSSTAMLADRLAARTVAAAEARGAEIAVTTIELRAMANEIGAALVSQNLGPKLTAAVEALGAADGVIAATPIYKAGVSGLFKDFFDVL